MIEIPRLVNEKNKWLSAQVDVEFPTAPSLKGKALYLASTGQSQYREIDWVPDDTHSDQALENCYLVDFHRLTVMFAVLQAEKYKTQADKDVIVEFFTQIMLSPPCQLYLGFDDGTPVAAGIITRNDSELLISDIVILPNQHYSDVDHFARVLIKKAGFSASEKIRCVIESD
ncbi:hypothetical protein VA7868_03464 [Vibrio aerogenes CECT 7868]|uniref:Flavodoxin n=1 Tax=Vibrio aerogenes CECT 7868 TaxID=1216006 RepID=A0A1M6A3L1_9VIBR|nr:hypothetical protein [Vibrio aerogenes]SHI31040.1 hypothetical protein VA7868_03464 [Vibrio aerogenes CECT 7868]